MIDYNKENISCLKMYNDFFYDKFIEMGIRVHKAEGAFYMFIDFSNFAEKFQKNKIKNAVDMCTRLISDLGIALLPGEAFGIMEGYTGNILNINTQFGPTCFL